MLHERVTPEQERSLIRETRVLGLWSLVLGLRSLSLVFCLWFFVFVFGGSEISDLKFEISDPERPRFNDQGHGSKTKDPGPACHWLRQMVLCG